MHVSTGFARRGGRFGLRGRAPLASASAAIPGASAPARPHAPDACPATIPRPVSSGLGRHITRFNVVGALGVVVQLGVVEALVRIAGAHYLVAGLAGVEATCLHNFFWHRHWTWADRVGDGRGRTGAMLLRYNLSTGLVSAVGNLVIMRLLVGGLHLPVVVANLATIAACSLVNFMLADRFVFPARPA